jgi:predicted transcriptional regulator
MSRTATIRIDRDASAALERGAKRFVRAWQSGKDLGSHFSFESPEALFRSITPARWAVIERLQALGPSTLRGLARELERDVKAVHRDVHALVAIGLVRKDENGQLRVPFAGIYAEFDLLARRAA